jgi:uncharacterized membrane protein
MGRLALSSADRQRISDAIRAAEAGHRGEIVVHIEPRVFGDPLRRAAKLFADKGVDRTKDHTGVLLYVATATRAAAVWAGTGVKDGDDLATWKPVFDALHADSPDLTARICAGIAALGEVLAERCAGTDVHGDELGDGVSA